MILARTSITRTCPQVIRCSVTCSTASARGEVARDVMPRWGTSAAGQDHCAARAERYRIERSAGEEDAEALGHLDALLARTERQEQPPLLAAAPPRDLEDLTACGRAKVVPRAGRREHAIVPPQREQLLIERVDPPMRLV